MNPRSSPTSIVLQVDPFRPSSAFESLAPHVERKLDRRWKEWEPWAIIHLHHGHYDPIATELARLRERHRQHVLSLLAAGVEMRLIRRHRFDDPRITDQAHRLRMEAAIERRRKERFGRIVRSGAQRLKAFRKIQPQMALTPGKWLSTGG